MQDRLIRRPEVVRITGLSASTLWRMEKAGDFPARLQLGPNSVAWSLKSINEFVESRKPAAQVQAA